MVRATAARRSPAACVWCEQMCAASLFGGAVGARVTRNEIPSKIRARSPRAPPWDAL